jgi:thioredoxin 1
MPLLLPFWAGTLLFLLLLCNESHCFTIPTTRTRPTLSLGMSATENEDTTSSSDVVETRAAAPLFATDEESTTSHSPPVTAQFGDKVSLKRPTTEQQDTNNTPIGDDYDYLQKQKTRNTITAIVAVLVAVLNYGWQYTHPMTSLQLLSEMQSSSQPLSIIGTNNKPTVVDFWAPWCENCKLAAPTLKNVEQEYSDKVNFCMVNGDEGAAWPYIEAFGVDAIPHLALVNAEGDVETALIGPIPKSVLQADLDVLIENSAAPPESQQALPYRMLDVFRDRPEKRRVHFDP